MSGLVDASLNQALVKMSAGQCTPPHVELFRNHRRRAPLVVAPLRKWDIRPLPRSDAWVEGSIAGLGAVAVTV